MEKKFGCFWLLLGCALFSYIVLAVGSTETISCPNAQQEFDCGGPQRTGQTNS